MLAIELEPSIEDRLDRLAQKTGKTKAFYARAAIIEHLGDLEDAYVALHRLENPQPVYTAQEVKNALEL